MIVTLVTLRHQPRHQNKVATGKHEANVLERASIASYFIID